MHKGYIVLTLAFKKEDRRWLARCEELGTATFGRSLPEADRRIKDAVLLHLNTLEDVGECERFLKEHHIEYHHIRPSHNVDIRRPISIGTYVQPYIQSVSKLTPIA